MSVADYTYTVGDTITTSNTWGTMKNSITVGTTSSSCTISGCTCNGYHYWWHPYTYYPSYYPAPIKLYQIFCPKPGCNGKFWAEIDETKKCPVCKKTIKITDKPSPDYEVEVTK